MTLGQTSFLAGLAGLAQDPLTFVLDALALVGLGRTDAADLGRLVAHHLLVGTGDEDRGVVLDREGDSFGRDHLHRVAVAGADHELAPLDLGAVAHPDDLELAGEALAHPFHHVGDEGAAEAVALAGAAMAAGGAHHDAAVLLADADALGEDAAEFSLGPLHGDGQAIEADRDLVGNGNRGFTDTGHGSTPGISRRSRALHHRRPACGHRGRSSHPGRWR